MVIATGNGIRILERCKFRFGFIRSSTITHAIHKILRAAAKCRRLVNYSFCDKPEVDIRVCEFQFWQFRDIFIRILAVSRLHLIDLSSIEHNCVCFNYTSCALQNSDLSQKDSRFEDDISRFDTRFGLDSKRYIHN